MRFRRTALAGAFALLLAGSGVEGTSAAESRCGWMIDRQGDAVLTIEESLRNMVDPALGALAPASAPNLDLLAGEVRTTETALVFELGVADLSDDSLSPFGSVFDVQFTLRGVQVIARAAQFTTGGTAATVQDANQVRAFPARATFSTDRDLIRIEVPFASLRQVTRVGQGDTLLSPSVVASRPVAASAAGGFAAVYRGADDAMARTGYRIGDPGCSLA